MQDIMILTTSRPEPTQEKRVPIDIQADIKKRNLIDIAATLSGRDRTRFILEAACQKAEEVILDRRLFVLDENAFDSFEQALESNPVRGNQCLKKLLARPNL